MFAGFRVDAGIGQHQALHRAAFDQVRLDNLRHIRRTDVAVPDRLRIDDEIRPMLALVQASGLVDANGPFQAGGVDSLLQQRMQLRFAVGVAAGTSASWLALIGTHKYMPLIL